jgi:hypothetical protein
MLAVQELDEMGHALYLDKGFHYKLIYQYLSRLIHMFLRVVHFIACVKYIHVHFSPKEKNLQISFEL